jgi:hypothetical protein
MKKINEKNYYFIKVQCNVEDLVYTYGNDGFKSISICTLKG